MIFMTVIESVNMTRSTLGPDVWKKVLEMVPTEIFIDQFLNRERLACQFITESIVAWLSKPIINKINHAVLPSSRA